MARAAETRRAFTNVNPLVQFTLEKTDPIDEDPADTVEFYIVNDETAALRIVSFAPPSTEDFLEVVDKLLEVAGQKNIPNLILDLRGNGGGSIPLGYQVIHRIIQVPH